jgi:hypothetical protein
MKTQKQGKPFSDEAIDELLKQGQTVDDINGFSSSSPKRCWNVRCKAS